MPGRKVVVLLTVGCCVALCGIHACAPKGAEYSTRLSPEKTEKVVFMDNRLGNDLRIDDLGWTEPKAGERMQVKLTVRNLRDKPIECRVKYKFRGPDGFTVDETNWMPVIFDRREVTQLQQKSLSKTAADFTVLIRYEKLEGFDD